MSIRLVPIVVRLVLLIIVARGHTPEPPPDAISGTESLIVSKQKDVDYVGVTTTEPPHVMEAAAHRVFRETGESITRILAALNAADSAPIVPADGRNVSRDMHICPLGAVRLGTRIAKTRFANVYEADIMNATTNETLRHVIVKHASDCGGRLDKGVGELRHQLLTEALILTTLASTGLVPAPIYVSSPATVIPWLGHLPRWLRTREIVENRNECTRVGSQARFLVQDKAGLELGRYLGFLLQRTSWRVMAHRAVTLIIRVIQMLQNIHDLGIVHGDISGSNILFKNPESVPTMNDTELVFIDFEYAVFFPDYIGTNIREPRRSRLDPEHLSPWHLQGFRVGRRDDVFRALELLAYAMSRGANYMHLRDEVAEAVRWEGFMHDNRYAKFKDPKTLFYSVKPYRYVEDPKHKITAQLDHIASKHLATLTHPDDRPEYDVIIAHLRVVQGLLSSPA